jgi:two-component system phosphate regulon response regulator PhoB
MSDEGPRILIVEDEESLSDSVRYNLEREGYTVAVARDGLSLKHISEPTRP